MDDDIKNGHPTNTQVECRAAAAVQHQYGCIREVSQCRWDQVKHQLMNFESVQRRSAVEDLPVAQFRALSSDAEMDDAKSTKLMEVLCSTSSTELWLSRVSSMSPLIILSLFEEDGPAWQSNSGKGLCKHVGEHSGERSPTFWGIHGGKVAVQARIGIKKEFYAWATGSPPGKGGDINGREGGNGGNGMFWFASARSGGWEGTDDMTFSLEDVPVVCV